MPVTESVKNQNSKSESTSLKCLDLFAGCGGLSLGFKSEGFQVAGAVEIDKDAAASHAANFFRDETAEQQQLHSQARDIKTVDPEQLLRDLGVDKIDVIIGGPPCQAFARVGRAKLREIADHPEAFLQDSRGDLYLTYLHFVGCLRPKAILMENVPDALNYGGINIAEEACQALVKLGYTARYTLLNSVFYGVPQMRERMFLIAYRQDLDIEPVFPDPTHFIELPRGYEGSRRVALKNLSRGLFASDSLYIHPPSAHLDLPPAVTARDALNDLPQITAHLEGKLKRGTRRFTEFTPYPEEVDVSDYAWLMRTWKGYAGKDGFNDHVIRYLPRDWEIFRRMEAGNQYPEAYRYALEMLATQAAAQGITEGTADWEALKKKIVPPYDPNKFPNKWRKMEPDRPARTLMAHLSKDSYSHIHYDSDQARTISVREAARLQSFPDGFVFCGTMNPAFRQIGNSVPPLLAKAIAREISQKLTRRVVQDNLSEDERLSVRLGA